MCGQNTTIIRCYLNESVCEFSNAPLFMAIGTFDGVHLGHRKLIATAVQDAERNNGMAVAYTFAPHPTFITQPHCPKQMIYDFEKKYEILGQQSLSAIIEQQFDQEFAAISPADFIKFLKGKFPSLKTICVGENFKFGHNKSGNVKVLQKLSMQNGINVTIIPSLTLNGTKISSSHIRTLMQLGNFDLANLMLGRQE